MKEEAAFLESVVLHCAIDSDDPSCTGGVNGLKESTLTSEQKRDAIVAAAEDKKANYITEIDLRGKTLIADFFIICSGTSNIHIRAIADGIMESLEKQGTRQRRMEGYSEATWILLDYSDVIVHVMSEEQREFYGLEKLWKGNAMPSYAPDEADAEEDLTDDKGFMDEDEEYQEDTEDEDAIAA